MQNVPTISYGVMAEIVRIVEYLKSFNFTELSEIPEKLAVYDLGEDYCDFTFSFADSEIIIEGSYYIDDHDEVALSDCFSVFNTDGDRLLEIDWGS